jgi:hypothetical protein
MSWVHLLELYTACISALPVQHRSSIGLAVALDLYRPATACSRCERPEATDPTHCSGVANGRSCDRPIEDLCWTGYKKPWFEWLELVYLSCCIHEISLNPKKAKAILHIQKHLSPSMHPGLPGVLRQSVKLRTFPHDISLRERVEKSCCASLAWLRHLHNGVANDNVLILEARSTYNSCRASRLCLLKTCG